ncbi:helix-turn-helix domain-containing protein [Aestuariivirga sp.]|uniref:helix-turn-helix domain-containing protein n=1 Tax=Aestuariivirga sp. TaxID=2650926 RepID=UPI00391B61EB
MTKAKARSTESTPASDQEAVLSAALGRRISALRKGHGLSFDALAHKAGVSKGTLVQIEQGGANPSISTLCRLAGAIGVSVSDLVAPIEVPERSLTVVGPSEVRILWAGPSGGSALLLAGTPGPDMLEIWTWVLMPGECFEASVHGRGTRELIHVTEGSVALEVDGQSSVVAAGSTAIALTDRPHAYRNPGTVPVRFTMVVHEPPASN